MIDTNGTVTYVCVHDKIFHISVDGVIQPTALQSPCPRSECKAVSRKKRSAVARAIKNELDWAKLDLRSCRHCGVGFVPVRAQGIQKNVSVCPKCSPTRLCPCCGVILPKFARFCEGEAIRRKSASREKSRHSAKAKRGAKSTGEKKNRTRKCMCGNEYDATQRRINPNICGECSRKSISQSRSRLRGFKEMLFTTLCPDLSTAEHLISTLDSPCMYCGSEEDITIEHKTPLIRGGAHSNENIGPACKPCNSSKQSLTEEEYRAKLLGHDAFGAPVDPTRYKPS